MSTPKSNFALQTYIFFDGRCEEAIEFYKRALGAEVTFLTRFGDCPDPSMCAPGLEKKIMHAELRVGGVSLLVSDGRGQGKPVFEGFSLSLSAPAEAEGERLFAALADGGKVQVPLGKSFFAALFGMLTDRFGVGWMVVVRPEGAK